ncbi:MAG: LamG-like jellyroll fold domain-containing protein, partial [Planctomycetota bacterium]
MGDYTTNDFTVGFWVRPVTATAGRIVSKIAAGVGYEVYLGLAGALTIYIGDAGGNTSGSVGTVTAFDHQFIQVNFDRSGNASAKIDGTSTGVTVDISAINGTITNAGMFTVGADSAGANHFDGGLHDVLIGNGLEAAETTYAAFDPPSDVTYSQTSTRKWSLSTEGGFGERLGTYGNGHWPLAISSSLVDSVENPLGYGFPAYNAVTNVAGYPNQLDQWGVIGTPTVTANTGEAPDGSLMADRIAFDTNGERVRKNVVGAGNIVAGERWCASAYVRRISGACTGVALTCDGDLTPAQTALTNATTWNRVECCSTTSTVSKTIGYLANVHGSCVIEGADHQYEENNTTPPCTACNGDVNCVCNASYFSQSWSTKSTYMNDYMERGEVVAVAAAEPMIHAADASRTAWETAHFARLIESQQPAFIVENQGGGVEALVKGKPLQLAEEKREYRTGWDWRNGLTNTNPRRYTGMILNDVYEPTILESRLMTATIDAPTPPQQSDLNAYTIYEGCDSTGANCYDGVIESTHFYARPAQKVWAVSSEHLISVDLTGPAYLANSIIPRFTCLEAATTECWIWPMSELGGGKISDRINDIELSETGSPAYQVFSGLPVRGQGRRGIYFTRGDQDYFEAPDTTAGDIGTGTELSIEAIARSDDLGNDQTIIGTANTNDANTDAGYVLFFDGGTNAKCCVKDGSNNSCRTSSLTLDRDYHAYVCTASDTGQWDVNLYTDGALTNGASTNAASGSISNSSPMRIGRSAAGVARALDGDILEARVLGVALSATQVESYYMTTVQNGTYWAAHASDLVHFKFNEEVATSGLMDHSGNNDDLTVVGVTPDPQYRDPYWPMGTGVIKPALQTNATNEYWSGGGTIAPDASNDFSMAAWIRGSGSNGAKYIVQKQGADPIFEMYIDASDQPTCRFTDSGSNATIAALVAIDVDDGDWHLLACRLDWDGSDYTAEISLDAGAFTTAGASISGTITGNANAIRVGELAANGDGLDMSGFAIWKNHLVTLAELG